MKKKGGFTIIEMVIVAAIIGILSGMTLIYNRSGAEQLKLFKEEAMVVGILNRARALVTKNTTKVPILALSASISRLVRRTFRFFMI